MEKEFYGIDELAELFDVNPMTIRRMVHNDALPYYKLGRKYLFKRTEIEAFLKRCEGVRLAPEPVPEPAEKPAPTKPAPRKPAPKKPARRPGRKKGKGKP